MTAPIQTLLRLRDLAKSAEASPDATHVILALTPGGEMAVFVDSWDVDADVIVGYYDERSVLVLPLDSAWSILERDAIELVDAATIEASAAEAVQRIFAAARTDGVDERRGYA